MSIEDKPDYVKLIKFLRRVGESNKHRYRDEGVPASKSTKTIYLLLTVVEQCLYNMNFDEFETREGFLESLKKINGLIDHEQI